MYKLQVAMSMQPGSLLFLGASIACDLTQLEEIVKESLTLVGSDDYEVIAWLAQGRYFKGSLPGVWGECDGDNFDLVAWFGLCDQGLENLLWSEEKYSKGAATWDCWASWASRSSGCHLPLASTVDVDAILRVARGGYSKPVHKPVVASESTIVAPCVCGARSIGSPRHAHYCQA